MPRPVALGRTSVAPAPSPNSTAVVRSLQSMMAVSFSDATTSTCRACSLATSPSATLRAYRNPVQAAPTSNAAACLAPSRAWASHACDGSRRSGEQVASPTAAGSGGELRADVLVEVARHHLGRDAHGVLDRARGRRAMTDDDDPFHAQERGAAVLGIVEELEQLPGFGPSQHVGERLLHHSPEHAAGG